MSTEQTTIAPLADAEVRRIRNDFPVLERTIGGTPLVYLDSGATSQRPLCVIEDEQDYVQSHNAAVHRGAHTLAAEATERYEDARETVAQFVGVGADELVWTSNATDGINLVATAIGHASQGRGGDAAARFRLGEGDEIVVTEGEHHANLVPWQELAARTGATIRPILVEDDGRIDLDRAAEIVGERTRVLAFTHVSNVTGVINPVAELVALARRVGALVLLDACQSAPHLPLDLRALDVDFAVFSGHKMLAPTGIGALYGRAELLNALPPFRTGGSMITTVGLTSSEYLPAPQRFEAGTQPVSQAIAFATAIRYLDELGMDRIEAWEAALGQRLVEGFAAIDGVRVLGPAAGVERVGLASVDVAGVHAHDVGQYLDSRGIAMRVGHHCAQPLHRRFGVTASTRASAYLYTLEEEVDAAIEALGEVRGYFGADR